MKVVKNVSEYTAVKKAFDGEIYNSTAIMPGNCLLCLGNTIEVKLYIRIVLRAFKAKFKSNEETRREVIVVA